ncbi:HAD family hydrolase [Enterovirga sp.]|uniref:HAD family hydrolase n=1 Tax=Enterovirga sp. TaxID=2026350 RepID=UPI0026202A24|nr:HAD family hydrolase [Enterovirga sp.]MDB5589692.1 HAD-superfamily hydrolase, subfamily variant 3 [Enterovirga sp.]
MTRAVIFDIDGTLIDSVDLHAEAWRQALGHFGYDVPFAEMRRQIGKGGDQLLPVFVPREVLERREEEISAFRSDLFKRDYLPKVRPFAAVPDLFRRVREAGLKTVLASSGKAEEVAEYVRIAGIEGLFDEMVSADDAARSKPAGDIFAAALAAVAPLGPTEAVVIGDTAWDVIAANAVGLATVAVRCGGFAEAELRQAGAVALVQGPAELLVRFDETPLSPAWVPPRR